MKDGESFLGLIVSLRECEEKWDGVLLSFKVLTHGFDKRVIREFLALSLREKWAKLVRNSDLCTRGKQRGKELLGCSSCLRRSRKRWGGACSLHGQVLVFGLSTCMKLWHYVLNSHWLHVGEISTILSHASCLIKTLTMYLIT